MRRKRNSRILFWPTLAATAVILVLLVVQWRAPHGVPGSPARVPRLEVDWSISAAASHPAPGTVNHSVDPETNRLATNLGPVRDDRNEATAHAPRVQFNPQDILAAPSQTEPTIVLLAPERDDTEELAGWSPWQNSASTLAKSDATDSDATDSSVSDSSVSDSDLPDSDASDSGRRFKTVALGAAQPRTDNDSRRGGDGQLLDAIRVTTDASDATPRVEASPFGAPLPQDALDQPAGHPVYGTLAWEPNSEPAPQRDVATDTGRADLKPAGIAWPRTPALEADLVDLRAIDAGQGEIERGHFRIADGENLQTSTVVWIEQVRGELLHLQSIPSISDPAAGLAIEKLRGLAIEGIRLADQPSMDRRTQEKWLRTAYSLLRRTAIWDAVWRVGDRRESQMVAYRSRSATSLLPTIDAVRTRVQSTGDPEGWTRYLMLDEIERAAAAPDTTDRKLLSQRLLSRVAWEGLGQRHREWLDNPAVAALTRGVQPWCDVPIDYVSLLAQIERQESDAIDLGGIDVAGAVQTLRFADDPKAVAVAAAINNYYRNANLRMAVSVDLLNRLLPEVPTRTTPIRQTIVGLPVRGTGVIDSQLQLRLAADEGAWNLMLGTTGVINGRTASAQWPVRVFNDSRSRFSAETPIYIDRQGVRLGDPQVDVKTRVRLRGMNTDFDGFPVIESLVRGLALSRYEDREPLAKKQSELAMRREIGDNVSEEVEREINRASDQLTTRLLGPLGRLRLDPLVVDLSTSQTRLAARYRIAGDWQLGAFTPRPRALSDSVLSMQVHQSLLNNAFEQLLSGDSPQPIREMMTRVLELFGVSGDRIPGKLPDDVKIQFASTRPVTVEIEQDALWLTLRVVRLSDGRGLDLSHFVVRAQYRPQMDGMRASLVREGVLRITGPRLGMRERLPVRAIFNKVLDDDRPLPLVSEELAAHPAAAGLQVGMLELTDGWLCLAITPQQSLMAQAKEADAADQSQLH
jgi:hypothetical protein